MQISTRKIVVAGVLLAVALVLAVTGLGYFPVPNVSDSATIMHVPGIIGAVLEGPIVGVLVTFVFAIDAYIRFSGLFAGLPAYVPVVVLALPRLFIGLGAWLGYRALKNVNEIAALAVAGVAGALTNTILVVALATIWGILSWAILPALLPQIIFEGAVAAIITVAVVAAWKRLETGRGKSSV
ncbi:MAG: ECF transporter S component [Anaerolineales bacterium]|nr:ECF transporter S component [Anaerolineales bacterium]